MTQPLFIRIWQPVDLEQIKKHLLIAGDVSADCGNCRELGLKYAEVRSCPACGTEFKFITARSAVGSAKSMGSIVKRIKNRCPHFTFVDYGDYQSLTGKQSARDLLG